MQLTPTSRWRSACCTTQVIVVKAPEHDVALECGGQPMEPLQPGAPAEITGEPASPFDQGTALGKRFRDTDIGLELLCTAAGAGSLSIGGTPLLPSEAKALPASD